MAIAGGQISLSQLVEQLERLKAESDALRARVDAIEAVRDAAGAEPRSTGAARAEAPEPAAEERAPAEKDRHAAGTVAVSSASADGATWSRRALMRRAGMAAVGGLGIAAAGALAGAQPALAAGNLALDSEANVSSSPTGWTVSDNTGGSSTYGLGVTDHRLSQFPSSATIAAHSSGTYDAAMLGFNVTDGDGVHGRADGEGSGVFGEATAAGVGVQGLASKNGTGVIGKASSSSAIFVSDPGTGVAGFGDAIGVGGLATGHEGVGLIGTGVGAGSRGAIVLGIQAQLQLSPGSRASHPTSRALRGDLYVDKTGRLWYCRTGGTHAVWKQLA